MKRFAAFAFVGVALVSAPGCGTGAEGLIKQMIADTNDLAAAIEKKESPERVKAAAERLKATAEKAKKKKVSKSEDEQLKQKYEKELGEAFTRLVKAAASNPEAAMQIGDTMQQIGKGG